MQAGGEKEAGEPITAPPAYGTIRITCPIGVWVAPQRCPLPFRHCKYTTEFRDLQGREANME